MVATPLPRGIQATRFRNSWQSGEPGGEFRMLARRGQQWRSWWDRPSTRVTKIGDCGMQPGERLRQLSGRPWTGLTAEQSE